ncbi:hypothetical protein [Arthrobacter nitrophenolicus]|uniref:Uncharacterized protein n=1 Tax=Arthrobacter nitrophenolicus TaxID=683150 RepID=L8TMJ0_9MICC|nr:hypothetical protein [Arthrobacter nitrophenolicus]ELT43095.1 hypothetical protein G205_20629 [Arthrobacter nitrophenolicus]
MRHDPGHPGVPGRQPGDNLDVAPRVEEHGHPETGRGQCHFVRGHSVRPVHFDAAGPVRMGRSYHGTNMAAVRNGIDEHVPKPVGRFPLCQPGNGPVGSRVGTHRRRHQDSAGNSDGGGPAPPHSEGGLRVCGAQRNTGGAHMDM